MTVQTGASAVRVATVGPDGAPRVMELPPGGPIPHRAVPVGPGGIAAAVAAAGHRRGVIVLDVGHGRSEAAWVRAGTVVARCAAPGCGALDGIVAGLLCQRCPEWAGHPELAGAARRAREALSLLPEVEVRLPGSSHRVRVEPPEVRAALREPLGQVVRAVRAVAAPAATPVLLIGGGARMPQLAELLDAAGFPDVTVAPRPDAAAVIGALVVAPAGALRAAAAVRTRWLPVAPARARRPWRAGLAAGCAGVLLVGLHLLGVAISPVPAAAGVGVADGMLVQYGYQLRIPSGWAHTGGLPERRRSLLTPVDAPDGSDLIVVESTPLGYDSAAEPERAAAELRAEFDAAVAAGSPLAGYLPDARVGGRAVIAYEERDDATVVRWYVVLDGGTQLSVGCRHTSAGATEVLDACTEVVASIGG